MQIWPRPAWATGMAAVGVLIALVVVTRAVCAVNAVKRVQRVSVGAPASAGGYVPILSLSGDGRYLAFASDAGGLVPGDTGDSQDVFVRDLWMRTTQRISAGDYPAISMDGHSLAFNSASQQLIPGDTNDADDVFVRNLRRQTTERVSVAWNGAEADDFSGRCAISGDGRFVAFESQAANLVPNDTNDNSDVFVRDRVKGTTERISVSSQGAEGDSGSFDPSISADGRFVVFASRANNLVPEANPYYGIFLRDRVAGTTLRIGHSRASGDVPLISANGRYVLFYSDVRNLAPGAMNVGEYVWDRVTGTMEGLGAEGADAISADGRFVAFYSFAALVPGDTSENEDVFIRDRSTGKNELVSVSVDGGSGDSHSRLPVLSADGRFVAFVSSAYNLIPEGSDFGDNIYVRDRQRGSTELASATPDPVEANDESFAVAISADGLHTAFASVATNLVPDDDNDMADVFVRDETTQTTERVSVSSHGVEANERSFGPTVSADGRYVVFSSEADNLVPGDSNKVADVFLRDRATETTERVSVSVRGIQGNGPSQTSTLPAISRDGRYIVFESAANNLVPGDTNGAVDAFVRDRWTGTTERVSLSSDGLQGNDDSDDPMISDDGRFVEFQSSAANLAAGDTNGVIDVFMRDRATGITERLSIAADESQGNDASYSLPMSPDGRFVVFVSSASNLVPGDTNGKDDVFVRDRVAGVTERVSIAATGEQANWHSGYGCPSEDGRRIVFWSYADNLVAGDTNDDADVFVRDRQLGTTERVSVTADGSQGNNDSWDPAISGDGRRVAFQSTAGNLVPNDANFRLDIFVTELSAPETVARARIAVFRPNTGEWFLRGEDGSAVVVPFGAPGDVPLPADYLGTGAAQLAVFRPATHEWFIRTDDGRSSPIQFGGPLDQPVAADYAGVGHAQIAVFRPDTGHWFLRDGNIHRVGKLTFGRPGAIPVPADYLGTGRAQLAVLQPQLNEWWIRGEDNRLVAPIPFGGPGDVPVPADYLGLKHAQIAVFRPATAEWFIRNDGGATLQFQFGAAGDLPVPGDYDGLGRAQIAVYRPRSGEWFLRGWDGTTRRIPWGGPADRPAPASFPPQLNLPPTAR